MTNMIMPFFTLLQHNNGLLCLHPPYELNNRLSAIGVFGRKVHLITEQDQPLNRLLGGGGVKLDNS